MSQVRVATPDDAAEILELHVASIRAFGPAAYDDEQVAAWAEKDGDTGRYPIEDDGHHLVAAQTDDEIAGYGHLIAGECEVRAVYVHPDYARDGVGSAILAHLEGYALGVGIEYLQLWASLNAVAFYERRGYQPTTEATIQKEYDGREISLAVMAMEKCIGK